MQILQSRRDFLASLSAAGAAGVLGTRASLADEGPPETTTIRLVKFPRSASPPTTSPKTCFTRKASPISATCLRQAGLPMRDDRNAARSISACASRRAFVFPLDAGKPITTLAGVHVGCYELFANERIRSIIDLKGKSVGVPMPWARVLHLFLAIMAAYVGLDPDNDIEWVAEPGRSIPWSCSPNARSMRFSDFPPSHRSCAPARSAA